MLSGLWNYLDGMVRLVQEGNDLFGEYQYGDDKWVGDLVGRILGQRVIYRWSWKDGSLNGVGFWRILPERLQGPYWFDYQCGSYEEALANPTSLFDLDSSERDVWDLTRFIPPPEPGRALRLDVLTDREVDVSRLVSRGYLNKQIARELLISEKTVKVYRGRIMQKLGVGSVPELVAFGGAHNL